MERTCEWRTSIYSWGVWHLIEWMGSINLLCVYYCAPTMYAMFPDLDLCIFSFRAVHEKSPRSRHCRSWKEVSIIVGRHQAELVCRLCREYRLEVRECLEQRMGDHICVHGHVCHPRGICRIVFNRQLPDVIQKIHVPDHGGGRRK
jgi:hypothetical protein